MSLIRVLMPAVVALGVLAAGPSQAGPKHCPPGHAMKGWCKQSVRALSHASYEQGYRDGLRDAWRIGERLPRDRYIILPDYDRYGWPRPRDGQVYVRMDERVYLIALATGLILDVLN